MRSLFPILQSGRYHQDFGLRCLALAVLDLRHLGFYRELWNLEKMIA